MAIGFPPLIPLYRVIPDPNARFDRFGEYNTQLFGKPLVTSIPNYQPSVPAWAPPQVEAQSQPYSALGSDNYQAQPGSLVGAGTASQVGTLVDLQA